MDNRELRRKYNLAAAEADLEEYGTPCPEDVWGYNSEDSLRGFLAEHDLTLSKYLRSDYKPEGDQNNQSNSSNSSGCYLTTACVTARGLGDRCEELQTLRSFRDGYLAKQPHGAKEICRYYQMAPGIVTAINQRGDRKAIWDEVYTDLVAPCVRLIHAGDNEAAYQLYREYSMKLNGKYGK